MNFLFSTNKRSYPSMTNEELREAFLTEPLFVPGQLSLTYTDVDRAVIGGAMPTDSPIELPTHKELAADYFCERRELGIINIGGKGAVKVDGKDLGALNLKANNSHYFFKSVPWSFKYHPVKKKNKGEDNCY